MALANWRDEYSVNILEIDNQHKKLFAYINEIHDAMKTNRAKEELGTIISKLAAYTVDHFKTEEKYFERYHYPDTANHKYEHQVFVDKVHGFQEDFKKGKLLLSLEIINFLRDWLINHIKGTDKKYSAFLNEKGIR
ncbi:MAG: hemerythrin family protein [Candidatus Marinimicrobia bacterium]|nr:hemerythrin family protein [Candidatus Neomarinimicrobiota bacterium]